MSGFKRVLAGFAFAAALLVVPAGTSHLAASPTSSTSTTTATAVPDGGIIGCVNCW